MTAARGFPSAVPGAAPLRLVIFDCDGVLIDSEPLCDRVVAAELTERGWAMTAADCHRQFLGMSFHDMQPIIEAKLQRLLGADWVDALVVRLCAVLAAEVELIPGAREVLQAVTTMGLRWVVASNSSHTEMAAKFGRTGLTHLVAGRLYSATDVIAAGGRGKPAPDLFLSAAAAEGAHPAECLVIEDSPPGVRAAVAAGMACVGFSPSGHGDTLRAAGATLFHAMADLPALVRARLAYGLPATDMAQIRS